MEQFYDTDDFLAKWADGNLTPEEKDAFKKTDEYKHYKAILEGTDLLEVPTFHGKQLYQEIKQKNSGQKKVFSITPKWLYIAAASIILLVSLTFILNKDEKFQTGYGEQLVVKLPDNSEVILNSNSILNFDESDWSKGNRVVLLEGEGFFKVEKGSDFTVNVNEGNVKVLGTQFTVNSVSQIFEVICYEGKVAINKNKIATTITQGQGNKCLRKSIWNHDQ